MNENAPETDALINSPAYMLAGLDDSDCSMMETHARKMERERDEARRELREQKEIADNISFAHHGLRTAVFDFIRANLHLADGDNCTLKPLKDAIHYESLP
jgi:hypothetical protein